MRAELSRVEITGTPEMLAAVRLAEGDLRKAGKITGELVLTEDAEATRAAGGRHPGGDRLRITRDCG